MNGLAETLEQLRDVHPPQAPGFWPPAPGWWLLAGFVAIALGWAGWHLWRHRQRARWRNEVMDSLTALENSREAASDPMWLVAEVSVLLRRVALCGHDRDDVAGLSGASWLAFLDRTGGGGQFAEGAGRILATGPYARREEFDAEGLLAVSRRWLEHNLRAMGPTGPAWNNSGDPA